MKAIKVSELNKYIKKYMAMDYLLNDLLVQGEISGLKKHSNGNIYLTLKDEKASIDAIIYSKDAREIKFDINEGDNVEAKASLSIYEKNARLSLYVRDIKLQGLGELYEKFLYLKDNLDKEGLFSQDHKKQIPFYPRSIGLITSPTGAAVKDFLSILKRRNDSIDVSIYPVNVQGVNAKDDILKALEYFSNNPEDVVVLTRGGGSLEDLFVFNDEELARAIYNFNSPIISAIGHEVDYVISDFVSDLRAPTPSAAAELVSMSKDDLNNSLFLLSSRMNTKIDKELNENKSDLEDIYIRLNNSLLDKIKNYRLDLIKKSRTLYINKPNLNDQRLSLEKNLLGLKQGLKINFILRKVKLDNLIKKLDSLSPENKQRVSLEESLNSLMKVKLDQRLKSKRSELNFTKKRLDYSLNNLVNSNKKNLFKSYDSLVKFKTENMPIVENMAKEEIISVKSLDKGEKINLSFKDGSARLLVEDIELRS